MKSLLIIHSGKAYYPEVEAYKKYFSKYYRVDIKIGGMFDVHSNFVYDVAIVIMGYYPVRPNAKFIIHDYRSASVGKFKSMKDYLKRKIYKPDLRVFLTKEVENFIFDCCKDDSCYIKMGVPEYFLNSTTNYTIDFDCCYVGDVNDEREFSDYINLHLKYYADRSLICIGNVENSYMKFQNSNIRFLGRKAHEDVLNYIKKSRVCVSHIPDSMPYSIQYSTKMLEYAAVGRPILANTSGSNLITARDYGITPIFYKSDLPCFEEVCSVRSSKLDSDAYSWPNVIEHSGIVKILNDNNVI